MQQRRAAGIGHELAGKPIKPREGMRNSRRTRPERDSRFSDLAAAAASVSITMR